MPSRRTVVLKLAGRSYRVVTNASEQELELLCSTVDARLRTACRGRPPTPDALALAAIMLAHDALVARDESEKLREWSRHHLRRMANKLALALDPLLPDGSDDPGSGRGAAAESPSPPTREKPDPHDATPSPSTHGTTRKV